MVSVSSQLANRTLISGSATDDRHKLLHVTLVVSCSFCLHEKPIIEVIFHQLTVQFSRMDRSKVGELMVITGNSHPELADLIAKRLGIKVGAASIYHKTNRETMVDIADSVRGKDVYIIQTGTKDVNNNIMELLIMAYACKTSSARSIVGVIPYLPYSKQCKMRKRGCIVSKLVAKMMCRSGLNHLITMDLHQKEIQGFFDCPVDNLRASPFLLQYIQESIPDFRNAVIVARDPGSAKKATSYAERLRLGIAVIHGEQKEAESDMVDGRHSPPSVRSRTMDAAGGMPVMTAKEKPPINVVGDVGGRIAIMVDDMIDDVRSFVAAAEVLKDRGAYKIYVMATHGLLSSDAPRLIEDSPIDEVVVTNTIPHEIQKMQCHKIKTVDISVLLAEAIRRIHNKESMSYLFRNVTLED
ncbi:phosphoribosyl pyrophosphate synthase-associated protein 2-like [Daphnia carinata]|uniref:phosphoribosyl pyrophosphate synthase-associated protein 2-like n=1 Tax=Daphnia carinata TaxID=120202 RepID=UPI00257BF37B|nr:phosphoribosyl pyrophosphate synthase-associated protein 2-like [Daphnia carinata]